MANIIIHNSIKYFLDQYEYFSLLVEILLTNPLFFTKYALRQDNCFPTTWKREKQEISTNFENTINK